MVNPRTISTDLSFISVTNFFIFYLCYPVDEKQQTDGSWVCYEQLGVWCNFNIPWLDSSPRPPILGEMGKFPQFCGKFDGAFIWRVVVTKRLNIWKIFCQKRDNRATFWWKISKSPFNHFWGTVADALGVPSGMLAMECHSILAV